MLFKDCKSELTFFFQKRSEQNQNKFFYLNMLIHPSLIGKTILIYCGNVFLPLLIKEDMVGFKLKDFVFTKKKVIFKKDKKDNFKGKGKK
jgi:ribosomal protein S19